MLWVWTREPLVNMSCRERNISPKFSCKMFSKTPVTVMDVRAFRSRMSAHKESQRTKKLYFPALRAMGESLGGRDFLPDIRPTSAGFPAQKLYLWAAFPFLILLIFLGLGLRLPLAGIKIPKIGKRGFRCKKTSHFPPPKKGCPESKNPQFLYRALQGKWGFFDSEYPFLRWWEMAVFDSETLFSRFWGILTLVRANAFLSLEKTN